MKPSFAFLLLLSLLLAACTPTGRLLKNKYGTTMPILDLALQHPSLSKPLMLGDSARGFHSPIRLIDCTNTWKDIGEGLIVVRPGVFVRVIVVPYKMVIPDANIGLVYRDIFLRSVSRLKRKILKMNFIVGFCAPQYAFGVPMNFVSMTISTESKDDYRILEIFTYDFDPVYSPEERKPFEEF